MNINDLNALQLTGLLQMQGAVGGAGMSRPGLQEGTQMFGLLQQQQQQAEAAARAQEAAERQGLLFQQGQEDREYKLGQRDITAQTAAQEKAAMDAWLATLPPEDQAMARANPEAAYKEFLGQQFERDEWVEDKDGRLYNKFTGQYKDGTGYVPPEKTSDLKASEELGVIDKYNKDSEEFTAVQTQYQTIENLGRAQEEMLAAEGVVNPQNDQVMIISLAKVYDPTSVVRGEEFDQIKVIQSLPERFKNLIGQVWEGRPLNPQQRKNILDAAAQKFKADIKQQKNREEKYRTQYADRFNFRDPEQAFPSYVPTDWKPPTWTAAKGLLDSDSTPASTSKISGGARTRFRTPQPPANETYIQKKKRLGY
jgi:hypothetical protein